MRLKLNVSRFHLNHILRFVEALHLEYARRYRAICFSIKVERNIIKRIIYKLYREREIALSEDFDLSTRGI